MRERLFLTEEFIADQFEEFSRRNSLGGDEDQITKILMQLSSFNNGLDKIKTVLEEGMHGQLEQQKETLIHQGETLKTQLEALSTVTAETKDKDNLGFKFIETFETFNINLYQIQSIIDKGISEGLIDGEDMKTICAQLASFSKNIKSLNHLMEVIFKDGLRFTTGF